MNAPTEFHGTKAEVMPAEVAPPVVRYLAVCAGLRLNAAGELVMHWYKVHPDGTASADDGASFVRKGKKSTLTDAWVGDIYEFTETPDGVCRLHRETRGRFGDEALIQQWRLAQTAAEAARRMDKEAAKGGFGKLTLDEAKERYRKTIGRAARTALIAAIIQHMTT